MNISLLNTTSNFKANYDKILEVLKLITEKEQFLRQNRKPRVKDVELITINLTSESMRIDSECPFFRVLPEVLKKKTERSVYNRRKRKLFSAIEFIRNRFAEKYTEFENYFVVDSMPLEVVKLARNNRSKICKEDFIVLQIAVSVQVKTCSFMVIKFMLFVPLKEFLEILIQARLLCMTFINLKDIKNQFNDCVILGDKGYLSIDYPLDLFESMRIN